MWGHLNAVSFLSLSGIVQEKINQDRIDLGVRVLLQNLPTNELDGPDRAAAKLDLPGVTRLDELLGFDAAFDGWTVLEAAHEIQKLGHSVVYYLVS